MKRFLLILALLGKLWAQCPVPPTTAAHVTANISGGSITGFTVLDGGNYPGNPTLAVFIFDSGGGSGATATAVLSGTAVNTITKVTGGSGYTTNTYVTVAPTAILSGVSPAVTAVCGVPAGGAHCGLGYSNPDGSKSGATTFQNQPPRCFNMYYGSDGPTNTDPIVNWVHGGGGISGSPDENYVLSSGSNPGVVPTIVNRGNKFNFYAHAYTLAAAVNLASMNATTTTATVSRAGADAFPTSYTSCFNLQAVNDGTGVVETMKVTGVSGGAPWNYTVVRGTDCLGNSSTPGSHTVSGQYAWFTDAKGNSPTYPAGFNDTECFAAFLAANAGKGQIPGNGMDIRPIGSSHGTAHVYLMRALGTQLYNPANCEWPRPSSTPFTRFGGISGVFDWAAISNMTSTCSQTGNCSVHGGVPGKSPDGTEPFFVAATAGAAAWGLTGPNPTNSDVTIGACGANGLAVVRPTSANAIVNAWSPQSYWSGGQCASGGGHCWGTPLNPLPPAFIATGYYDGDVSADTQNCFVSQVPGVTPLKNKKLRRNHQRQEKRPGYSIGVHPEKKKKKTPPESSYQQLQQEPFLAMKLLLYNEEKTELFRERERERESATATFQPASGVVCSAAASRRSAAAPGRAGYLSRYSRYRRLIPARAAICTLLRCSSARRRATRLLRSPGSAGDGQDSPRRVPLAPSQPSGPLGLLPRYVTHAHRDHGPPDRAPAADAASPPRFSQLSSRGCRPAYRQPQLDAARWRVASAMSGRDVGPLTTPVLRRIVPRPMVPAYM